MNYIKTDHDRIPDFAAVPTIQSTTSGRWSDPTIWSQPRVPTAGDRVLVRSGHNVTYDLVSNEPISVIGINGTLRFATLINTRLVVGTILVYRHGSLQIGMPGAPVAEDVKAELLFADQPLDLANDPEQWSNGLLVLGHLRICGRAYVPFVRVAAEPLKGQNVLALSEPVNWRPGDSVFIPDTRQLKFAEHTPRENLTDQRDVAKVRGLIGDKKWVLLDRPLQHDHFGWHDEDGRLNERFLPHVFTTSRNISIRSQNPSGTRGHIAIFDDANVDIRYANFMGLGRTKLAPIDNTTFRPDGSAAHVGANQMGRYAMHFHHCRGPWAKPAYVDENGEQYAFNLSGNTFCWDRGDGTKWGVVLHDSHFGRVSGNVLRDAGGAGIVTEDGNETSNVIEKNLVFGVRGTGGRDNWGLEGAGFWFRGPKNLVSENVATNIMGDTPEAAYGYKYYQAKYSTGRPDNFHLIPAKRGERPWRVVDMNAEPIAYFSDNEVYGATESGLTLWWVGMFGSSPRTNLQSSISDFTCWHVYNNPYYGYETSRVVFYNPLIRGDWSNPDYSRGFYFADYPTHAGEIYNPDIEGLHVGIEFPRITMGEFLVRHGQLKNHINTAISTPWSVGGSANLPPRLVEINGTNFCSPHAKPLVILQFQPEPILPNSAGANYIQKDEIVLNRISRENERSVDPYRAYWAGQHKDAIVPLQNANNYPLYPVIGCPEPGLTNAQAWERYGIAVAGEVAPAEASTNPAFPGGLVAWGK